MNIRLLVASLVLSAATFVPVAAGAQQNYYANGYRHRYPMQIQGIIANIDKTVVTMRNGRHIFLNSGTKTVINPTGRPLRIGQTIAVYGPPGGEGSINAREIDILRG
jgi:hypothetical protein